MKNEIELLAPGGDIHSIKAALAAGANAIYCGLNKFNARNRAENITLDQLPGIIRLAHENECALFLTLNILLVESELPAFFTLLNQLVNTGLDGIILQDLGMLHLVQQRFPSLAVHASTQLTTHNAGQIKFLHQLGAQRVNLCRELSLEEIRTLTNEAHAQNIATEVFIHGSNCVSFSGLCYASSVHSGNSGNRGRCSQPCRDAFKPTAAKKTFPLNMKDTSTFSDIESLRSAGVDALKIEGRIKSFDYVYSVVHSYRQKLDGLNDDGSILRTVFNRDLTPNYLKGQLGADMFTDSPRDHAAAFLATQSGSTSPKSIDHAREAINKERSALEHSIQSKIAAFNIEPIPLTLTISGARGTPLTVSATTPSDSFTLETTANLQPAPNDKKALTHEALFSRMKAINDYGYRLAKLDMSNLPAALTLPFREITQLKDRILSTLTNQRAFIAPVEIPKLKHRPRSENTPTLSVLLHHIDDLKYISPSSTNLHFQLPSSLNHAYAALLTFFKQHPTITPWFPSLLLGDDFSTAVRFLAELNPQHIVTNNSSIAMEACKRGIPWTAGPQLNLTNSYSLLGLQKTFQCSGAFVSNELSRHQIGAIKKPDDFKLHYRIFHPIELMTSRQCLTQQIDGCENKELQPSCLTDCARTSTLTHERHSTLLVEKSKGNYHRVYHGEHFLNTDIITDIPGRFDHFLIDLSPIKTATTVACPPTELIKLFTELLHQQPMAAANLQQAIQPTTMRSYLKGI